MNVDEKAAGTTNERRAARGEHEAVRARDIVTEDVVTMVPDTQVAEVARVLLRHRISTGSARCPWSRRTDGLRGSSARGISCGAPKRARSGTRRGGWPC